ncbi:fungal-specific transcription factor domain-containing protein [Xylogone sp. PMI_703]|nr:fungal-specific transcription factor domain-containing protein [Xylogone sp. PMI_703]
MPDDQDITLSNHYFSSVCCINSCFDSLRNPFRSLIEETMLSCPLVFHCVMAMSAAHLFRRKKEMLHVVLKHRNEAISCLLREVSLKDIKLEVVLGSILLGMTSAWHDPSSLGITHLHSARKDFKKWIAGLQVVESARSVIFCRRNKSFLVGIIAYWEALISFLIDQEPDVLSYLSGFCQNNGSEIIYPNPWTGISTPIFVYIAQVGALSRQCRLLRNLSIYTSSNKIHNEIHSKQFEEAVELERNILQYTPPKEDHIEDHCDELTPLHYLRSLSQIYRFVALLQLYITFPDLLIKGTSTTESSAFTKSTEEVGPSYCHSIVVLAVSILNIISSIQDTARINVLFTLPLLIAGSALQNCPPVTTYDKDPIMRATKILDAVWMKADIVLVDQPSGDHSVSTFKLVQWMDIMAEEHLESIFG